MENFDWTCPFCNRGATITESSLHTSMTKMHIKNAQGEVALLSWFVVCPNANCKRFSLRVALHKDKWTQGSWQVAEEISHWQLIPSSKAMSFPDYIPKAVLDDYNEACQIVDLSPKASATLSRRCMQGILRDFWSVKPGRLVDEIGQVRDKVEPLTWDAIEAVREIGNIGAHMEKEIDLIVDVEPHEAQLLIGLIETLIKDWYISREERRKRLELLRQTAQDKQSARVPAGDVDAQ